MKYFLSTQNFSPDSRRSIPDTVQDMLDEGITQVEISSLHPYESHVREKLQGFQTNYNAVFLLHNFAPAAKESFLVNLSDIEPIFRKRSREFIKERILLTKELGMDYFSFHAGFCVNYKQGIHEYDDRLGHDEAMDVFIDELKDIVSFASDHGVHLGVENHVCIWENTDNLLLFEKTDFQQLFEAISSKYLHLHLDLGHLKVTANEQGFDREEFLSVLGDKVMAMHVHDNTGVKVDCHAPFTTDFWFKKQHFQYLTNIKYVILETKTYGDMDLIRQMLSYLQEQEP
jgi:sugar phosphate isomerase/epimerase